MNVIVRGPDNQPWELSTALERNAPPAPYTGVQAPANVPLGLAWDTETGSLVALCDRDGCIAYNVFVMLGVVCGLSAGRGSRMWQRHVQMRTKPKRDVVRQISKLRGRKKSRDAAEPMPPTGACEVAHACCWRGHGADKRLDAVLWTETAGHRVCVKCAQHWHGRRDATRVPMTMLFSCEELPPALRTMLTAALAFRPYAGALLGYGPGSFTADGALRPLPECVHNNTLALRAPHSRQLLRAHLVDETVTPTEWEMLRAVARDGVTTQSRPTQLDLARFGLETQVVRVARRAERMVYVPAAVRIAATMLERRLANLLVFDAEPVTVSTPGGTETVCAGDVPTLHGPAKLVCIDLQSGPLAAVAQTFAAVRANDVLRVTGHATRLVFSCVQHMQPGEPEPPVEYAGVVALLRRQLPQ
jgi:hypothetical protein